MFKEKQGKVEIATIDIVKSIGVQLDELLEELQAKQEANEHTGRYLSVLERDNVQTPHIHRLDIEFAEALKKLGFGLFVTREKIVSHFKYAALLWDIYSIPSVSNKGIHEKQSGCLYTGDIPDFALGRIATAKKVRNQNIGADTVSITIHSNIQLSIEYIEAKYKDPIAIAWNDNPAIIASTKGCTLDSWQDNPQILGCIIAMWGENGQPL